MNNDRCINGKATNETREERANRVAMDAEFDFWQAVAKHYPEAQGGDFPPGAAFSFSAACEEAVSEWVGWNCPQPSLEDHIRLYPVGTRVKVSGDFMIDRRDLYLRSHAGIVVVGEADGALTIKLDDHFSCLDEWGNALILVEENYNLEFVGLNNIPDLVLEK